MSTYQDVGEISSAPFMKSVEWKIKDYFELPQKVDVRLESPTFNFGDAIWCLRLYPNGESSDQTAGWISLFLMKKQPTSSKSRIQFSITIMRKDRTMISHRQLEHTFQEDAMGHGVSFHMDVSQLKKTMSQTVPDGVLTVVCIMNASTWNGMQTAIKTDTPLGVDKLAHDFNKLLLGGEATDITLNVKNREYKAHRAVLTARSTVFSAMLKHDMKEKNSGVVPIEDCDPDAFQQFLTYLYSGHVPIISVDTVVDLHTIADKYDTQELKLICIQFMKVNLSVDTFCDVLCLSLRHNESELLEKAVEYFATNMRSILVTAEWLAFIKERPVEANELYIKAVDYNAKSQ